MTFEMPAFLQPTSLAVICLNLTSADEPVSCVIGFKLAPTCIKG